MNFVREIMETNAVVTMDKLTKELPKNLNDSMCLKVSTTNYLQAVYVKFTNRPRSVPYFNETKKLMDRAASLKTNINEVTKVELEKAKYDVIQCQKQVKQIDENLKVCYAFNEKHELLLEAQSLVDADSYLKAAKIYETFRTIDSSNHDHLMVAIQQQALVLRICLIEKLETILNEHIKYSITEKDDVISYDIGVLAQNEKVEEAIKALAFIHRHQFEFLIDLKKILLKMFIGIVKHASQVETRPEGCVVRTNTKHKDGYSSVISNLLMLAEYLSRSLTLVLNDEGETVLDVVRANIEEDCTNTMINDCLEGTIPDTEAGLETYKEIEERIKDLQSKLIEAHILSKGNDRLVEFASNVKVHFVNKRCEEYQLAAINLMKKDLHSTVIVGDPYDPNDLSFSSFPQCAISKSVVELMNLAVKIIQKEIACAEGSSGYYLVTCSNILSTYETVVKDHHQRLLQTIPQQMAIYYNNCKYIAHELTTPSWTTLLQQLPAALHEDKFTCLSQHLDDFTVQMLQEMANEEVGNIKARIDSSGISTACDRLEPTAEKAVRQCLRQQELLKTVWQKVLNYFDYNSTMGVLLDALCKSAMENILKISDIPTDVCEQLVDILKLIVARGPKLFTEPKEIHMYVTHWAKLNEVVFVLNSGLEQIGERWADGKGPLALHFTPEEMRALIRALFQNTDARAALLGAI